MLLHNLPDDSFDIIFSSLQQILDLRSLQCTCRYFHKNELKNKINCIVENKKKIIKNTFPDLMIRILGGYNDVLHYNITNNLTNIDKIDQLTIRSLYKTNFITVIENQLLLGKYSRGRGFVSFSNLEDMKVVDYVIYQEYNHKESDWLITDFHYLSGNKIYSNTIKLLKFCHGYINYSYSLCTNDTSYSEICTITDLILNIDKKKQILGRY